MVFSAEKKVGFFFIVGLIIFGIMLELGEQWNPFARNLKYKTYLESTTGLKPGDAVRLSGVEVGKINAINLEKGRIRVDFEVKPGTDIHQDSVASIRLTNLLGGQFLGISFGSETSPLLPPGSTVASKEMANIDAIVDNVGNLTNDAKVFISDLNHNQHEVMTKISSLLDENRGSIRNSLANIDSITTKFDRGTGSLALLLNDRSLYRNADAMTANLAAVSARIERGEGTLGKLVKDDALYVDAKSAVAGLNDTTKDLKEISARINRGEGTIGKLVKDDSLYVELRDASHNVKEISRKINDGEGTLGKLVNDDRLYHDATATLKKTEKAMDGLADSGAISVLGSIVGTLF